MDLNEQARRLGMILGNFQSLEFAIRAFLYERGNPPHTPLPPGLNLDQLCIGDSLPENAMTDFSSLGRLIDRYNVEISKVDPNLKVDPSVVGLRDALAHGRVSGPSTSEPLNLLKFSKAKSGQVTVEFAEKLTSDWLDSQVRRVLGEIMKVAEANGVNPT